MSSDNSFLWLHGKGKKGTQSGFHDTLTMRITQPVQESRFSGMLHLAFSSAYLHPIFNES